MLLALGDENRQHLILEMMQMNACNGVRVGTITEKKAPFPPCGFPPYSYFEGSLTYKILQMLNHAKNIMENLPNRSGKESEDL